MTALTAQTTPWDPKNVCRAVAHAATAQRCVLCFVFFVWRGWIGTCPHKHPDTPNPTLPTTHSPRRQYILGMDGRFVLTPLLMVPEPLADAIAYAGTGRHRLRPAWVQGQAAAGGSEGDETVRVYVSCVWSFESNPGTELTRPHHPQSIRVIKEVSDETKDSSTAQGASD